MTYDVFVYRTCPNFFSYEICREDGTVVYTSGWTFINPERAHIHAKEYCERFNLKLSS